MVVYKPSPESKGEIRECLRKMRKGDTLKLMRHRYGPILPDGDDAAKEDFHELLLLISLGPNADLKMRNAIEVWCPWMRSDDGGAVIDDIMQMPPWKRWHGPDELGRKLMLNNPDRELLKLWRINPCDMGKHGMAWWKK